MKLAFQIAISCALGCRLASAQTAALNPIERLNARLASHETVLIHDGSPRGYLMSVLDELAIDPASQMLVFSKTSLQMERISPQNPRGLFFNDEVSVGYVPGGNLIEFATYDAEQGVVFYTLDAAPAATSAEVKPLKLEARTRDCGSCHSSRAGSVMVVQSVFPQADGTAFISLGTIMPKAIDHRTPLEERWGGWYVTGTHGRMEHMGNATPRNPFRPLDLKQPGTFNRTSLVGKVDTSPYPLPSSDIVALMTFEHQMYVTNLIARLKFIVSHKQERADGTAAEAVEQLVEGLFFSHETPLTNRVRGVSDFAANFTARGPRDNQCRSLRDFDLQQRMFRYRFSYMIYSPIFDSLPEVARKPVLARVRQVLAGQGGAAFEHLSPDDRRNIREILAATKPRILE